MYRCSDEVIWILKLFTLECCIMHCVSNYLWHVIQQWLVLLQSMMMMQSLITWYQFWSTFLQKLHFCSKMKYVKLIFHLQTKGMYSSSGGGCNYCQSNTDHQCEPYRDVEVHIWYITITVYLLEKGSVTYCAKVGRKYTKPWVLLHHTLSFPSTLSFSAVSSIV